MHKKIADTVVFATFFPIIGWFLWNSLISVMMGVIIGAAIGIYSGPKIRELIRNSIGLVIAFALIGWLIWGTLESSVIGAIIGAISGLLASIKRWTSGQEPSEETNQPSGNIILRIFLGGLQLGTIGGILGNLLGGAEGTVGGAIIGGIVGGAWGAVDTPDR